MKWSKYYMGRYIFSIFHEPFAYLPLKEALLKYYYTGFAILYASYNILKLYNHIVLHLQNALYTIIQYIG